MATQVQLRRGTSAQHNVFTGANGEITVDTDKDTVVVHDGTTQGGTPLATESHNHTGTYEPVDATILKDADIGSTVQAYDADIAKTDTDQAWTGSQRATPVTDADGSFDMNAANDFLWTPTANDTLEFTNETSGQRGMIRLDNTSGYIISLGAEIDADANAATTLSTAGKYTVSYWCYDGTNVAISYSQVEA